MDQGRRIGRGRGVGARPPARHAARALGAPSGQVTRRAQTPNARRARTSNIEGEVLKLAFEVGLHLEELKPQHLRVNRDRMIASTSSLRLVNELVGLDSLLGDGVDGPLEDVALPRPHAEMLVGRVTQ